MPVGELQLSWRERWAVQAVNSLHRIGLDRLAYSSTLRWLGKRLLLRTAQIPGTRAIASGLGQGLKLRVLPGTPQSYWMGTHEPAMQQAIREQIKPGMVVYDCGANIGYFSVIFAALVGAAGRVYAFEPSPDSLACLQAAGELNGFPHLTVIPEGVWSRKETLRFARGLAGESLVSDHVEDVFGELAGQDGVVEIPATSLDEFVYSEGNPPPDFIKLDVEGSEGKANGL
jgi:FkbM family methyltransferase